MIDGPPPKPFKYGGKMKFKSGMLGLCIVVLSLFGTILAGFCLDVESNTRTVTNYEYVTDVTGLFDIGNAPQYIEYNPSSNYTGYAYNSVNYTPAGSINQYRYVLSNGSTVTSSYTITKDTDLSVNTSIFPLYGYGTDLLINWRGPDYPMGNTTSLIGIDYNINVDDYIVNDSNGFVPKVSTFDSILSNFNIPVGSVEVNITLTDNTVNGEIYPVIIVPVSWFSSATAPNDFKYYYTDLWHSSTSATHQAKVTSIKYNPVTGTPTGFNGSTQLWEDSGDNIVVINHYATKRNGTFQTATCSTTFNASTTLAPTYGYMDPSAGVTMNNSPATWSNGYENSDITITVAKNTATANNLVVTAGSSWVSVTRSNVGNIAVSVHGNNGNETKNIGQWDAVQLRLNLSAGTVSVTPIIGEPSYINPINENGSTVTFSNWYNGGNVTGLTFSCTGTSMAWGVTRTLVFLNTYGVVMNNPAININDHFPELNAWRLNFYSFATVGESMTVNNQTFNIGPNQTITVTNGSDSISGTLSDIYISKDLDGHIIFSFNGGKSIDLGEAVTDTISFTGFWYFTTGLFNAYQGTEEYYDWNIDSLWHATGEQTIVIYLGLLAFGVIFAKMVLKANLKAIDGLVLIFGAIICLVVGGVII